MRTSFLFLLLFAGTLSVQAQRLYVLNGDRLRKNVAYFNAVDAEEAVKNYVPNAASYDWLMANVPLFDCPDSALQTVYDFRWWSLRKHLKETPDGFIFTEFITKVNHAGKHNAISSALGHHIYEGRWLRNQQYLDDYIRFWLYVDPKHSVQRFHAFSSWIDDAVYARYLVQPDGEFIRQNLPALAADYRRWEEERRLPGGLFYQFDVKDAMEESISGSRKEKNRRPTINSYMFGNALAISRMAKLIGNDSLQVVYKKEADRLQKLTVDSLWDARAVFFKVKREKGGFADAREAIGYIPWYFNLPADKPEYAAAWDQLTDEKGFHAKWGLTTAERRHPLFRTHGSGHGCEWDGPVWPYATTQTLKALANLLDNYRHHGTMTPSVFYGELLRYARSHTLNGHIYLGEYQDEKTGEWLKGDIPRSKFYNHSGFADLVINDLIGIRPAEGNILDIKPLLSENTWDWFCLDGVPYHGRTLTVLYDRTGRKYGKGKGFLVFADGKKVAQARTVRPLRVTL